MISKYIPQQLLLLAARSGGDEFLLDVDGSLGSLMFGIELDNMASKSFLIFSSVFYRGFSYNNGLNIQFQ